MTCLAPVSESSANQFTAVSYRIEPPLLTASYLSAMIYQDEAGCKEQGMMIIL